jgi:hypothetical protein
LTFVSIFDKGIKLMVEKCVMETYSITRTLRNFGHEVPVERSTFDLSQDLQPLARSCSDLQSIRKMINLLSWACDEFQGDLGCAVYAVGVARDNFAKVGISHNPGPRLKTLQNGHYRKLSYHGLLWVDTVEQATEIERLVLRAAREMGIYERGEWLATDAAEVLQLALKAARHAGIPCRDSETALSDFANMRLALKAATASAHRDRQDAEMELVRARIAKQR